MRRPLPRPLGHPAAVAALGLLLAARPLPARAQGNYRSAPLGGRSVLMGGTGVALANDGSGPFLNPATITRVDDARLDFSVNIYTLSFIHLGHWFQPGPVDAKHFGDPSSGGSASGNDLEFHALPSTLCLFLFGQQGKSAFDGGSGGSADKGGKGRGDDDRDGESDRLGRRSGRQGDRQLALCFATLQRDDFGIDNTNIRHYGAGFESRQAQSVRQSWNRFAIGPSYAFRLDPSWTLGASLHGYADVFSGSWVANSLTYGNAANSSVATGFGSTANGYSFELNALVGATYHRAPWTFALAVDFPSLHAFGRGHAEVANSYINGTNNGSSSTIVDGTFAAYDPFRFNVGAGLEWPDTAAELDLSVALPMGRGYQATLDGSRADVRGTNVSESPLHVVITDPAHAVFNVTAGGERMVTRNVSVLAGVNTDFSVVPSSALADNRVFNFYSDQRERVGASVGMGSYGTGGELLFGVDASYGWGDRLAVNGYQLPPALAPTPHSDIYVTFVIAGSTSLRTLKRVYDEIKSVVKPSSGGEPEPAPAAPQTGQPAPADSAQPGPRPAGAPAPAPAASDAPAPPANR